MRSPDVEQVDAAEARAPEPSRRAVGSSCGCTPSSNRAEIPAEQMPTSSLSSTLLRAQKLPKGER